MLKKNLVIAISCLAASLPAVAETPRFVELAASVVEAPTFELRSIVPSADGRHLYSYGSRYESGPAESLSLWDVDDSGLPHFRRAWSASDLGVETLAIQAQVLSPDDRHLYVVNRPPGETMVTELIVFQRLADGRVQKVQRLQASSEQHPGGIDGLNQARHLALSPDGRHLYAGGSSMVVLARDADGRLTAIQEIDRGTTGILVAADGSAVWTAGPGILTTYVRDPGTGALTFHGAQDDVRVEGRGFTTSRGIWPLPGGGVAVVGLSIGFLVDSYLVAFAGPTDGGLEPVATAAVSIGHHELHVTGVTTSPTRDDLFVASFGTPGDVSIQAFRRQTDGQLTMIDRHVFSWRTAGSLVTSADGTRLYGGIFDLRPLVTFDVTDLGGEGLELLGPELSDLRGTLEARKVRVAPNGEDVYVASYGSLTHFKRTDAGLEEASRLQLDLPPDGYGYENVFDMLEISPDGRLLVTNIYEQLALAGLGADGTLEWIDQDVSPSSDGPFTFSPDGRFFYASRRAFKVVGERLESLGFEVPSHPDAFVPDGSAAYGAAGSTSPASILELDRETGDLVVIGELDGMSQAVVSPDGRHLYTLRREGELNDPGPLVVRVYEIGISPSDLRWLEEVEVLSPDSSSFVYSDYSEILLDPAGRFLYVRPIGSHQLHVYRRDLGTGRLGLVEVLDARRHEALETALTGLRSIAVSPSGNDLYVASAGPLGGSLSLLRRPCLAEDERNLCLRDQRLRVEARWRDFEGRVGDGRRVIGTGDSGLVWFFGDENWEMLVKVLDGCSLNEHFWVFAAATTNVEYSIGVTDTITGKSVTYSNPLGVDAAAITDTEALDICSAGSGGVASADLVAEKTDSPETLALQDGRFELEVDWRDFSGHTGSGRVVDLRTDDSGIFYFFAGDNWEMLVKVLDGCAVNDSYWVFGAATTNVEYTLRVTDTRTGASRSYRNPLGRSSPAITDTGAFAGCP